MANNSNGAGYPAACCLDPHIPSFEKRLADRNYEPGTIKTYRVLVRRLASLMVAGGIAPEQLTADLAAQLVRSEERSQRRPSRCRNIARRFAEHLIELGIAPVPVPTAQQIERARLRTGYEDYLHRQRGLSQRSILRAWVCANRFLDEWRHRSGKYVSLALHILAISSARRDATGTSEREKESTETSRAGPSRPYAARRAPQGDRYIIETANFFYRPEVPAASRRASKDRLEPLRRFIHNLSGR